jgi:pimeloyl-ACP methyl ester carboxylesterase
MSRSAPVDGFALAYDRHGAGDPVVLLHGWPGDRTDFEAVVPLLAGRAEVVVPDLRGFGASDKHPAAPADAYSAAAQARSVLGLLDELGLRAAVLAGYDIGSRVAQTLPGAGERVQSAAAQREYWYQPFHALGLVEELIDGRPEAVRAYLRHFWSHWSGPAFEPDDRRLDHLVEGYGPPGALAASVGWYRAGSGTVAMSLAERPPAPTERIAAPTTVLWPEHDPLFPRAWSDRLAAFFGAAELEWLDGVGHFTPVEAPGAFAAATLRRAGEHPGRAGQGRR